MTHLLDTNTCVEHLRRGSSSPITTRISSAPVGSIALCSVVLAELLYGAYRSANPTKAATEVQTFSNLFTSLPFNDHAAEEYAKIRSHLASLGTPIGPNDLMIAAIALANHLTLVTHNTKEFSRIPGLLLEDWQIP